MVSACLMATTMGNHCSDFGHHDEDEDEHSTSSTRASLTAAAHGDGEIVVRAMLESDHGDVELLGDEMLRATATPITGRDEGEQELVADGNVLGVVYEGLFYRGAGGAADAK